MKRLYFPNDFLIGCATSSYQVEGALHEDGRESCIWDSFSRKSDKVYQNQNGEIADDQYHLYEEDIDLMSRLGFKSYRFSIAWPRIISYGKINSLGLEHYKRLCRELHKKGMKAMATLYHWDLPQSLEDKGGWLERNTAYEFARYAKVCFEYLADDVDMWITLNEPFCSAYLGYGNGIHAPGLLGGNEIAAHHLNLAHGLAVSEYRKLGLKAPIGISLNPSIPKPSTQSMKDVYAAKIACAFQTDIYLDPLISGEYPKLLTTELGLKFLIEPDDMALIRQKIDFIGINYYSEHVVSFDEKAELRFREEPTWQEETNLQWPVVPFGLLRTLQYFAKKIGNIPLYITENGAAYDDVLAEGRVHDRKRCDYYTQHLEICNQAIEEGINLKGYFAWSFLDNYEWTYGYTKRFGIVYVDFKTQKRYPKDSAYMFRDFNNNYIEY